jgi:hypothetical protein
MVLVLAIYRREGADGGMESIGVAEAFDEPKDQVASLWSVGKRLLFDELAFERGKERFAEGAVVAIVNRTR